MTGFNVKALILILICLGACTGGQNTQPIGEITFSHLAPIMIKVEEIQIINRSQHKRSNDITMRLPVHPILVLEKWADQRLKPVGNVGKDVLFLIVQDMNVGESVLKESFSLVDFFTEQPVSYTHLTLPTKRIV